MGNRQAICGTANSEAQALFPPVTTNHRGHSMMYRILSVSLVLLVAQVASAQSGSRSAPPANVGSATRSVAPVQSYQPTYSGPAYSSPVQSAPVYRAPSDSYPVQSAPSYQTYSPAPVQTYSSGPIYSSQPVYSQPIYSQPVYSQPVRTYYSQPSYSYGGGCCGGCGR
jgi:hypothetical protein